MQVHETKAICSPKASNGRVYLNMIERTVEHNGRTGLYHFVSRTTEIQPPENKRPDAVVICATVPWAEFPATQQIILVDEFRPAIGRREICFPAGLIEAKDYEGRTHEEAAKAAAIREFKEETGLTLTPTEVSPNLYSSAGMTDESCMIVFGTAEGKVSAEFLEKDEDIRVLLWSYIKTKENLRNPSLAFAKVCWPFLWTFARGGL